MPRVQSHFTYVSCALSYLYLGRHRGVITEKFEFTYFFTCFINTYKLNVTENSHKKYNKSMKVPSLNRIKSQILCFTIPSLTTQFKYIHKITLMFTSLRNYRGSPTSTVSTSMNSTSTIFSAIGIKFVLVEIGYVVPTTKVWIS